MARRGECGRRLGTLDSELPITQAFDRGGKGRAKAEAEKTRGWQSLPSTVIVLKALNVEERFRNPFAQQRTQ